MKKAVSVPQLTPERMLLVLGAVLLVAIMAFLVVDHSRLNKQISDLKKATDMQNQLVYNEVDSQKLLQRPVVTSAGDQVVFPELRIALPYNEVTKNLQYTYDQQGNLRVTSAYISDHKTRQLSCSELVRVNLKSGTPYSPWEEKTGSVQLSNGQTLYILAAKARTNKEGISTMACAKEVWTMVTPQQVAAEFAKARAY